MKTHLEFNQKCFELLKDKEEALNFILAYSVFIEMLDDYIDKDVEKIPTIDEIVCYHTSLHSSNYWRANADKLFLIDQLIHVLYGVSNQWMQTNIKWKLEDARSLSHCGYLMRLAILILECGTAVCKEFAPEFMEHMHLQSVIIEKENV